MNTILPSAQSQAAAEDDFGDQDLRVLLQAVQASTGEEPLEPASPKGNKLSLSALSNALGELQQDARRRTEAAKVVAHAEREERIFIAELRESARRRADMSSPSVPVDKASPTARRMRSAARTPTRLVRLATPQDDGPNQVRTSSPATAYSRLPALLSPTAAVFPSTPPRGSVVRFGARSIWRGRAASWEADSAAFSVHSRQQSFRMSPTRSGAALLASQELLHPFSPLALERARDRPASSSARAMPRAPPPDIRHVKVRPPSFCPTSVRRGRTARRLQG